MTTLGKGQTTDNHLYWVSDNIIANDFPPVSSALRDPDGLLAIGGDLQPGRILDAYERGIFPWFSEGQPILWWSPNPRCVLELDGLKISKSLHKTLRKDIYQVTFNRDFKSVMSACSGPRGGSHDTWITENMMNSYSQLHETGNAISVETWHEDKLVGGLYGVVIGKIFFGESMFSRRNDASKVALVYLVKKLNEMGFRLIDCQVHSHHLQRLGAKPIARDLFINILDHYCNSFCQYDWDSPVFYT